ncbi:hypothetical protein AB0K43_30010 [Kitasatospora sp. NPDC049258]|uniref:hypothetical protein n=1 Tax=Kitasatospora sp. NPDC049258 TaxID=3155394 RepID=UPI00343CC19A
MTTALTVGIGLTGLLFAALLAMSHGTRLGVGIVFAAAGGALCAGIAQAAARALFPHGIGPDGLFHLAPSAGPGAACILGLLLVAAYVARRLRLCRMVDQHADRLALILANVGDHVRHRYPSQAAPSAAVARRLRAATGAPWWRSRKALLELRHAAVTAAEDARAVLRQAPQDDELRAGLTNLLAVRDGVLDAVHVYCPSAPRRS